MRLILGEYLSSMLFPDASYMYEDVHENIKIEKWIDKNGSSNFVSDGCSKGWLRLIQTF